MLSMNKAILMGTLVDWPVVRELQGGQKMVGLSILTTRRWHDAKARRDCEEKEWHQVVIVHERLADYAEQKLSRDDQVYLEGSLHTRFWHDQLFELQSITKIILWQEGDQLRRLTDADDVEPIPTDRMLAVAEEADRFDLARPRELVA